MNLDRWVGVVLAGGASRRMGRDKSQIEVDGLALVTRAARALGDAGAERVLVVGGDQRELAALDFARHVECPVVVVADDHPGEGPLGGIVTAFDEVPDVALVVLACDLPFASAAAVRTVLDHGRNRDGVDVVVPVVEGRRQYLHALWSPTTQAAVRGAFAGGDRSVRAPLSAGLRVDDVDIDDPEPFFDVDTPSQLEEVERVGSAPVVPRGETDT